MGKVKMTLEEKLEEAIVKDAPYEVPENWVWSNICNIILTLETGKRPKGGVSGIEDGIPSLGGEHLNYNGGFNLDKIKYVSKEFADTLKKGVIEQNDILIVKDGATTGKTSYVDNNFPFDRAVINEHVFKCRTVTKINSKFIFWFIVSPIGQELIKANLKGSAQGGINTKFIENFPVSIPPLKEQQRIVNRIESLFEKLDKAKELIEEARDGFEQRKAAILENAIRGELTNKWRCNKVLSDVNKLIYSINLEKSSMIKGKLIRREKELPKIECEDVIFNIPKEWIWIRLGNIANKITDGTHKTPNYLENGIPFLSAKDIKSEKLIFDNCKFISEKEYNEINNRCNISKGTVLVSKSGTIGNVAVVEDESKFGIFESLAVINTIEEIDSYYISYALKTILLSNKDKYIKGTGVKHLHLNNLKNIVIPLPPVEEQKEIVRILNKLLEEESKIEELTQLEEQIELIKKSILAKAFRGELGTNCKEDESAFELLKQILSKQ